LALLYFIFSNSSKTYENPEQERGAEVLKPVDKTVASRTVYQKDTLPREKPFTLHVTDCVLTFSPKDSLDRQGKCTQIESELQGMRKQARRLQDKHNQLKEEVSKLLENTRKQLAIVDKEIKADKRKLSSDVSDY